MNKILKSVVNRRVDGNSLVDSIIERIIMNVA